MIGDISKRDQVLKFWNSARPSIQKELWRNKLNPELSSWNKVVAQAEIIEIAENVAERRDRRTGQTSQAPVVSGSGGGPSKNKHHAMDGSVWVLRFLSFFVSPNVSFHYAVLSFVGLIHMSSIVSSYVSLFVLHIVSSSFYYCFIHCFDYLYV